MINNVKREPLPTDGIMRQYPLDIERDATEYLDPVDYYMQLSYGIGGPSGEFMVVRDPTGGTDLSMEIDSHCIIEIELSGQPWKFSTDYRAITTKHNHTLYNDLRYVSANGTQYPWSRRVGNLGPFKKVRFEARKKTPPSMAHGFCLNVDFQIPGIAPLWLPVSIDPEIINPKPGNGLLTFLFGERVFEAPIPLFSLDERFQILNEEDNETQAA